MTLEFEGNNAVFDGHNVDVSTISKQVRPNILENQVHVLSSELEFLGGVESRRGGSSGCAWACRSYGRFVQDHPSSSTDWGALF